MKPITLHPVSVLAGLALAALAFVATGAVQTPLPTRTVFVGEIPAQWWTHVDISGGGGYTVPQDRYFVVTTTNIYSATADGLYQDLSSVVNGGSSGNGTRLAFAPGTVLSGQPGAHFWGYLEPVN